MSQHFEHFGFETNLGLTIVKYFKKLFLTSKSRSAYLKNQMCEISINPMHFQLYPQSNVDEVEHF